MDEYFSSRGIGKVNDKSKVELSYDFASLYPNVMQVHDIDNDRIKAILRRRERREKLDKINEINKNDELHKPE